MKLYNILQFIISNQSFLVVLGLNHPTPDTNKLTYLWPWSSFPMILTWLHITLPVAVRYFFIFLLTIMWIDSSCPPSYRCLFTDDLPLLGPSSAGCCTWCPLPYTPSSCDVITIDKGTLVGKSLRYLNPAHGRLFVFMYVCLFIRYLFR